MTPSKTSLSGRFSEYGRVTRSGTYGFLAALPLLAAYEILILLVNHDANAEVRVGADVWIKQLLASVGGTGMFVVGLVVLVIGITIVVVERKRKLPLRPRWFAWMLGESVVYAVVIAAIISQVVAVLFYAASIEAASPMAAAVFVPQEIGLSQMLALSLGAGLYEELVFRVVLVTGLAWGLKKVMGRATVAYVIAAVVGAVIFSAVHYIGAFGDPFTMASFTFRFLFGLALNGLYLARGFGVAAWTHALYDILVVTHLLG